MRISPRLSVLAALAAGSLALAACGGGDDTATTSPTKSAFAAGSTMAKLQSAGAIKVGTKFDQPGFGLQGLSGSPEGFDVEIAKLIVAKLGIPEDKIQWVESPSKVREENIEQGKADIVVATYTINDKRKERITFAGPYYVAGQALMVRKDESAITKPEDLKTNATKKVCSVTGSTPAEKIKEYLADQGQLTLFDVYSKCADALKNNQVDVVTTDNVILLGLVSKSDGAFKLSGEAFTEEPYGIGIKKGDTAFCQFIDDTLKEADSSGAYKKAWDDTAGKIEGAQPPTLPKADTCS
jgi:glutamate transport system substrate-binding protein